VLQRQWRKSTKSNSGNCVEARWQRSSHSSDLNCVETRSADVAIQIRDSKDVTGPILQVSPAGWQSFVRNLPVNA
jgi:hypothetical protein